jgi:hypothetical protein
VRAVSAIRARKLMEGLMRAFGAGLAALAFVAAFTAGCGEQGSGALKPLDVDAKSVEAFVTKLAGETFKGKTTTAADIASLRDALPKEIGLSWGNLSFDSATNSTLLTDVKLTPKDMPQIGLGVQELRLFDFDADFAKARLTGQRLTESAALASRIDAKGVSLFGMAGMLNEMMGGQAPAAIDPASPPPPTLAPPSDPSSSPSPDAEPPEFDSAMFEPVFDRYDFTVSRVIVNDLVLRPFEVAPAPAASAAANPYGLDGEGAEFFQTYIAAMRAFGIDTLATYDMKADVAMKQMGQTMSVSFGAKSMGTRGWRGGDADASYARDLHYLIDMDEGPMSPAINMQYAVGYVGIEDMLFDKLYGYMAKGVAPPRTETNIFSFGNYLFENQKLNIGGTDIMTIGESTLDAREFHWFIPTKITASAKNAVFDVAAMMEMAEAASKAYSADFGPPDPDFDQPAAAEPDFAAIKAALEKNGFAKPNLNFNLGWNWNATSGETMVDMGFGGENLMQFDTKYEGAFPSFKAVSDLVPDDPMQMSEAAIGQVFDEKSTLKLIDTRITDNGGLAKMFNLSADLAPLMGGADMGTGQMTGDQMRQMAAAGLQMVAIQAGSQMPEIPALLTPISEFITSGGKLRFLMQPSKPMTFNAASESLMSMAMPGAVSPAEALKQLGLKVEHSK